jgi:hypothetical protein
MHKNVSRTLYILFKKVFVYFQCTRKRSEKIKRYERHQHCTEKIKVHLYSLSSHSPQFQQSAGVTPL